MSFCLLALVTRTVVTVLKVFLGFELQSFDLLRKTNNVLQLRKESFTLASRSTF